MPSFPPGTAPTKVLCSRGHKALGLLLSIALSSLRQFEYRSICVDINTFFWRAQVYRYYTTKKPQNRRLYGGRKQQVVVKCSAPLNSLARRPGRQARCARDGTNRGPARLGGPPRKAGRWTADCSGAATAKPRKRLSDGVAVSGCECARPSADGVCSWSRP